MEVKHPILAIDYGEKHFGLAVSDHKGLIAQPLDTISITKNRDINKIIEEILEIAEEHEVKTLLIGMPQAFTEKHNKTTEKINKFINKIKDVTTRPIITYDESFSTTLAQSMLTSSGQSIRKSRKKIDSISATVFLQEYLNSLRQPHERKQ
ncbi:Holliday junction resolvase RuvX [Candidatus Dojkabacteria bacterium]|jgi:putative Holliday junction resolvase|nr:Holliday junction resolvase RuvX [Candidatus Dojkabacteria bacterium]